MSADARFVIVNADDFGMSAGINRGIAECHESGVVTSASLMVRWPAAPAATEYARAHPALSVGLHLDMGEWVVRDSEWVPLYEVLPAEADAAAYRDEARRQLERFVKLLGRAPSHVDSHQHCHRSEPLREIALEICRELRVPLRDVASPAQYVGDFYGQWRGGESHPELLTPAAFIETLSAAPPGVTELGCHPADEVDFTSPYDRERLIETRTLCTPEVRAAMQSEGRRLISFRDLPSAQIDAVLNQH